VLLYVTSVLTVNFIKSVTKVMSLGFPDADDYMFHKCLNSSKYQLQ